METFYYFAYGSNMLTARLRTSTRCPSAEPVAVGNLAGRMLAFRKASNDGSAKCDIPAGTSDDVVHGVVFRIASSERGQLDQAEGVSKGYDVSQAKVVTSHGTIPCVTYFATRVSDGLKPYDWYLNLVLAGALEHSLPEIYVTRIAWTPAAADPMPTRQTRLDALLALDSALEQLPDLKKRLIGAYDGQALA